MMLRRSLFLALLAAFAAPALAGVSPAEKARIDRLIQFVESRKDVKFIRNGSVYSSADAARFLRGKFDKMGEHVNTAQEFIEQIAAKSSTSGQSYLIRFADGRTEPSAKFLTEELQRMDSGK
jgi:hypothetical protein